MLLAFVLPAPTGITRIAKEYASPSATTAEPTNLITEHAPPAMMGSPSLKTPVCPKAKSMRFFKLTVQSPTATKLGMMASARNAQRGTISMRKSTANRSQQLAPNSMPTLLNAPAATKGTH